MSEKFLTVGLEEEIAEVEAVVDEDVAAAKREIVGELRAIGERLKELEARVERVRI